MGSRSRQRLLHGLAALCLALAATATPASADLGSSPKALAPIPAATLSLMEARDTVPSAPILMRTFKKESELELWKLNRAGRYVLVKTFPICRWSGQLGPKQRQGDRMAPEGFYPITAQQMNPNSSYHLSFDIGFPNAYDRAHGASGSFLMVHGICSSMGCYAMTNEQISEIWAIARAAFMGGQRAFQFQAYPFRMTARNMARARTEPHIDFWRQLKEGSDRFEATGEEPEVGVANGRYVFAPFRDKAREALAQARLKEQAEQIAKLVDDGSAAVRITYSDGGQHPLFAAMTRRGSDLGPVSRPEALALAGREVTIIAARPKPILFAKTIGPATTASLNLAASSRVDIASLNARGVSALFMPAPLGGVPNAPSLIAKSLAGSAGVLPAAFGPVRLATAPARARVARR